MLSLIHALHSSLSCWVTSPNNGRSSAPGLTSSQTGVCFTTRHCYATICNNGGSSASHASTGANICDDLQGVCLPAANCRLTILDFSGLTRFCFDSPYIASARTHRGHRFQQFLNSRMSSLSSRTHREHRFQRYFHWLRCVA
jgi:hypothetical protein